MPKTTKRKIKKECDACNSKGYYTQFYGIGTGRGWIEKPRIHRLACPKCNFYNKRKLKDIQANAWS